MELRCMLGLSFAVLLCIANAASDVCSNITYTTIDDIRRSTAYDTTTDLCDRGVIKDGSWYRFKSAAGDKMPESNPGTNHCGTFIPIWMNGNHPARLGETVSRDACAAVPFRGPRGCGVQFDIKVVNCGGFFLYQLKEPKYCNYAYCAGSKKVDQSNVPSPSLVPPRILNITASSNILYDHIVLKCDVEGNPSPYVWWTKDNIRLQNGNRTFVIGYSYIRDEGTYYCHARNNLSYSNASFELNLHETPLNYISYKRKDGLYHTLYGSSYQLRNGQDFHFSCDASGYPNVRVTWKRQGTEIPELRNSSLNLRVYQDKQNNGRTLGNSNIYFKDVSCQDAGNYSCESTIEGYDDVDVDYVHIQVISCSKKVDQSNLTSPSLVPPRILNITASSNRLYDHIVLKCDVEGNPSPHVWLTKDNSLLQNGSRTYVIIHANIYNEGTYYCHARNNLSYSNASFELNLHGTPRNFLYYKDKDRSYMLYGSSYQLCIGQDISFSCDASGYPNVRVTWKRQGTEIQELHKSSLNLRVYQKKQKNGRTSGQSATSHIYFKDVSCQDAGIYSCESIIEGYDDVDVDYVHLQVISCSKKVDQSNLTSPSLVPPTISNITASSNRLGDDILLKCDVEGNPSPYVWWTKDNIRLQNGNRTLLIRFAHDENEGTYYCHARNNLSYSNASFELNLHVVPRIDIISYNNYDRVVWTRWSSAVVPVQLFIGQEDERVRCRSSGYPNVRVTWKRNGIEIADYLNRSSNTRVYQQRWKELFYGYSELHLKKVHCDDAGNYTCESSVDGYDYVDIRHIEVTVVPSPVFMTTVISNSTQLRSIVISTPTQTCTLVTPSPVLTQFTGTISAHSTTTFASVAITPTQSSTLFPSGPVVFEKEPETSITGIRLSWKPISKKFWNGEEITFQVDVYSVDYILVKSHTTKKNMAIISGLLPATIYIVNITGSTVFGPVRNRTVAVKTKQNVDECQNEDSNSCHEYAHCKDVVGTYICTCFEGFFGDGEECRGPAQIISKSPPNITEFVETNVTLVCTVIAEPNPTTVWTHIDVGGKANEIKRTSDKFDGNYTIFNARVEDSGTYFCKASNALGYDSYKTEIKIKPAIVNISVEIKLSNKTFSEELKNQSSPAYQELKNDVYLELYNFFNNTPGFKDIEILGFVKGSVKVLFKVVVKVFKPSKETNDVVAVKIGRKIYKQLKTGRIGKIAVIPDALKLNAEPPPPANVSYSDVKETKVHIYWDPPELHEVFSIQRYYISFLKHGNTKWSNETVEDDQLTNFQVANLESDTFYTLTIIAENECCLGQESKRMEIKTLKVKVVSPWYYLGPIIAIVCVILLVLLVCLVRRFLFSDSFTLVENRKQKSIRKEEKESFLMIERGEQGKGKVTCVAVVDRHAKGAWDEIPLKSIEISKDTLIPGDFSSTVVRGTFSCNSGKQRETCSIKMLKEHATTEDRRGLMNELRIISAISYHENIVNLIGACTKEEGPLLLMLEFCSLGTLESNLRDLSKSKEMFKRKAKISLANEIAKGMKHLSDARIVHRDLAARNILVTSDFTPKISNFGLSRDIYERSSYQKLSSGKLPVRWLAIESFTDGLYTTKTDVWSFAVVMWEIETEGGIPYQGCEDLGVIELINQIKKGYRLSKPEGTSDERYNLMLQCWDPNPENRPTFHDIVEMTQMHIVNNQSSIDVPHKICT